MHNGIDSQKKNFLIMIRKFRSPYQQYSEACEFLGNFSGERCISKMNFGILESIQNKNICLE
jgi:hypothetical protein